MRKETLGAAVAIGGLTLLVVLGAARQAAAKDAATPYPSMAPLRQYLMDRSPEIALARSAAPESVSRDATVLTLGRHGFQSAVKGKNGFVCMVARSWTSAPESDFWNPKVRVPMCFNAAAARSYLVRLTRITDLILSGRSEAQMTAAMTAAVKEKELPPMASGAMCFMMGKPGYGGDSSEHWPPHLMFFFSHTDPASWGADLPGSPVLAAEDPSEELTSFVVVVQRWSDGTAATPMPAHVHH